ncbi:MAG: hypothetical protein GC137_02925 [Alphaproteobacteria bacterium]|nr:hypothetical protein [Alphaproteobacteria bacterium]
MSNTAKEQKKKENQAKDDPLQTNSMAAFHEKMPELKEALSLLVIRNNSGGRNNFRQKWPDVARYMFGEKLIEYDNEGTKDREHRAQLEDEASLRRIELNKLLENVIDKSVDKGILNAEYVGETIDKFGVEVIQFVYAADVIERVRPGKLAIIGNKGEGQTSATASNAGVAQEGVRPIETHPQESAQAALQNPDSADMPMPEPTQIPTEVPEEKAEEILETPVEEVQPEPIAAPDSVAPVQEKADLPSPGKGSAPEPEIIITPEEIKKSEPQSDVFAPSEKEKIEQAKSPSPKTASKNNPFAAVLETKKSSASKAPAEKVQKQDVFLETPAVQEILKQTESEQSRQNEVQSEPLSLSVSKKEIESSVPLRPDQSKPVAPVNAPASEPQQETPKPAIFGMKKSEVPNPVQAPTAEPQRGHVGYYKTVFNMAAAKR